MGRQRLLSELHGARDVKQMGVREKRREAEGLYSKRDEEAFLFWSADVRAREDLCLPIVCSRRVQRACACVYCVLRDVHGAACALCAVNASDVAGLQVEARLSAVRRLAHDRNRNQLQHSRLTGVCRRPFLYFKPGFLSGSSGESHGSR